MFTNAKASCLTKGMYKTAIKHAMWLVIGRFLTCKYSDEVTQIGRKSLANIRYRFYLSRPFC